MTLAWYGHLKWFHNYGILNVILISWSIALLEYTFQVPANRFGFVGNGGSFSLFQLKIIQEAITLTVFIVFSRVVFHDKIGLNQVIGFFLIIMAVYFIFKN
jgi:uncharacterized protein (DUF486 family)